VTPGPSPLRRRWSGATLTGVRSPLRSLNLTSILGAVLLVGIPVVALTGLASHAAYVPDLGRNNLVGDPGVLDFFVFEWPTSPSWLYALTQGIHVTLGIVLVPVVLAKLWSVIPKLFQWPPATSPFNALERLTVVLLVGGLLFEFATGIVNIQLWYEPLAFGFVKAHFYGAWVFLAAFGLHLVLKVPIMWRNLRVRDEVQAAAKATTTPTMSRRHLFAIVGGSSAALFVLTAGQAIGGPLRDLALLAPHGQDPPGDGPNDFQVNKTAASVGIAEDRTGPDWRLEIVGPGGRESLSREQLAALARHTHDLPIACVEGWTTTQAWNGVRLRDLAARVGGLASGELFVESLQEKGAFASTTLAANQFANERSLLALRVNGADLSLDHGYPARVIAPAVPGVHNTKWVRKLTFRA
jgi:DMSO/TMAO reductase YedYZ molybdopterin-dependent catalytic subunit